MIRLATAADGEAIAKIYQPIVSGTAISFELVVPTVAELERRIVSTTSFAPWLVYASLDNQVQGYAYASKHRDRAAYQWSVDVAVYIDETHRRQGIGRALYTALSSLLRVQGFYAAHAGITLPNAGSVALHESLGFRPIGIYRGVGHKLGKWHDVGWWQLSLRERDGEPASPLSVAEAQRNGSWRAVLEQGCEEYPGH